MTADIGPAPSAGAEDDVRRHLRRFFGGHHVAEHQWRSGPACRDLPYLRVAEIGPGPRVNHWVYATVGAAMARADQHLEYVVAAPAKDERHVELLTMVAWYHMVDGLGLGHTLPIGKPWLPASSCDGLLVSLPYPWGPALERCPSSVGDIRVLWLIPITDAERRFKRTHGMEALERRFENAAFEYVRADRPSVVGTDDERRAGRASA